MASQAKLIPLPRGVNGERTATFSPTVKASFVDQVAGEDGPITVDVGECPLGAKHLLIMPRMCGDWYCEIQGKRFIAAIGPDRITAAQNAFRKLASVA